MKQKRKKIFTVFAHCNFCPKEKQIEKKKGKKTFNDPEFDMMKMILSS